MEQDIHTFQTPNTALTVVKQMLNFLKDRTESIIMYSYKLGINQHPKKQKSATKKSILVALHPKSQQ